MKTYNFPELVRGDTFEAFPFKFNINGTDVDFSDPDNTAKVQFRLGGQKGKVYHEATIGDGLTANDPAVGWIKINEFQTATWPAGVYYYDVELNLNGKVKTYIGGTISKVIQDTTN